MSEQFSSYIDAVKIGALIFFTSVLIIFCMAQYVGSAVTHGGEMPAAVVAENLTLPGRVYPRQ